MTLPIEKGVPVPPRRVGRNRIIPWAEMAPGDSVLVPTEMAEARQSPTHWYNLAYEASRQYPDRKFVCRKVPEGFRIFRVR